MLLGSRVVEPQWLLNSCWLDAALAAWSSILDGAGGGNFSFAECAVSNATQPAAVIECWKLLERFFLFHQHTSAGVTYPKARAVLTALRDDLRLALAGAKLLDWRSTEERDDLQAYVSAFHNDHVSRSRD